MEHVILWEQPPLEKPEFRLYYDDKGKVLFYTCSKPEGNFIVIDAITYAESRLDIRIVDGKISRVATNAVVYKLMPDPDGTLCAMEDMSIVVDSTYSGPVTKWKLNIYELD